jgi:hypothetical protein
MTLSVPETSKPIIRPLQYRDLEAIDALILQSGEAETYRRLGVIELGKQPIRSWYRLRKFFSLFPHPAQKGLRIYVAERSVPAQGSRAQQILGLIQVSSFNNTRSTWRVERILLNTNASDLELLSQQKEVASQLVRYCLENIWEARTWILEVDINEKHHLALYRENGFQPLAQMTYWEIKPELFSQLAESNADLPTLLPVSNADAQLLYQLDCIAMPPLLRQVFDRHIQDFKTNLWDGAIAKLKQWLEHSEIYKRYVFESQRKVAIGHFQLELSKDGSRSHQAKLIVHPAYTWLYPKLISQMVQMAQGCPPQSLELASADYQPEREEYLNKLGATPIANTLLMSRSVWHKIKESKPLEGLQLSEVLQGLKPARTPIPSRISWFKSNLFHLNQTDTNQAASFNQSVKSPSPSESASPTEETPANESSKPPNNGHHA